MKQETLEEAANEYSKKKYSIDYGYCEEDYYISFLSFRDGAKWQQDNSNINALDFEIDSLKREIKVLKHEQEKSYNEKEVYKLINDFSFDWNYNYRGELNTKEYLVEWFNKNKKK